MATTNQILLGDWNDFLFMGENWPSSQIFAFAAELNTIYLAGKKTINFSLKRIKENNHLKSLGANYFLNHKL